MSGKEEMQQQQQQQRRRCSNPMCLIWIFSKLQTANSRLFSSRFGSFQLISSHLNSSQLISTHLISARSAFERMDWPDSRPITAVEQHNPALTTKTWDDWSGCRNTFCCLLTLCSLCALSLYLSLYQQWRLKIINRLAQQVTWPAYCLAPERLTGQLAGIERVSEWANERTREILPLDSWNIACSFTIICIFFLCPYECSFVVVSDLSQSIYNREDRLCLCVVELATRRRERFFSSAKNGSSRWLSSRESQAESLKQRVESLGAVWGSNVAGNRQG